VHVGCCFRLDPVDDTPQLRLAGTVAVGSDLYLAEWLSVRVDVRT